MISSAAKQAHAALPVKSAPVPKNVIGFAKGGAVRSKGKKRPTKVLTQSARNLKSPAQGALPAGPMTPLMSTGVGMPMPGMLGMKDGGMVRAKKGAASYEGPTLLHVGERSPKDKNYETSEVVLAAPGTVVAPIPKGMEVTPENAAGLLFSQILKTMAGGEQSNDEYASSNDTAIPGYEDGGMPAGDPGAAGGVSPDLLQMLALLMRASGMQGQQAPKGSQGGSMTQPQDVLGFLQQLIGGGAAISQDQLGRGRLGLDTELGRGTAGLARDKLNMDWSMNSADRIDRMNQASLARQAAERQGNQDIVNRVNDVNINNSRAAADNAWRFAQIQAQKDIAGMETGQRREEAGQQFALGQEKNRQGQEGIDITRASNAFDELTKGVGQAALSGVRAGRMPGWG